jgi:phosphopantetheinyl transferase (holo-ACP synthase)
MIEVFNIKKGLFFGILDLAAFAREKGLNAKREIETLGKNYLMARLLDNDAAQIVYDDKGKPYLANDPRHISLSHSHDKLVMIINEHEPTGIDIELIRNKVLRIRHKFLSPAEMDETGENVEKLLVYWAAKETLYKIYGLKEVDFISHLFVKPFIKHNLGTIIGEINLPDFKKYFELNYQSVDDYILVYALSEISLAE